MNDTRSSTPSLRDIPVPILQFLKCSICYDLLKEPVTTGCGHTFCKNCLDCHTRNNTQGCPLCKHRLSEVKVTIVLKDILKEVVKAQTPSPDEFTGKSDEVPCDICPDTLKYKAVKSCLTCLTSLCKIHLYGHQNTFRKHALVAPLMELKERACTDHSRPLELYLVNEEKLICSGCVQGGTNVVTVEDERDRKQKEMGNVVSEMKQKIQEWMEKVKELDNSRTNCLALIDQETNEIQNIFNAIKKAVQKAEDEALKPLKDRRRQVEQQGKQLKNDLQSNITKLSKTISELITLGNQEDHVFFLQKYPSVTMEDYDYISAPLDTTLSFGTIRNLTATMMANIKDALGKMSRIELERIQKFRVNVTLDPNSGHGQLIVSDDKRRVRWSEEKKNVPECAERFDVFGSILGQNQLTKERAFWVVEVGNNKGWDIGVTNKEANRKGELALKPSQGYWAIVHYNDDGYAALEDPPTRLFPASKPGKVGVFLDYSEKLVSFYDVDAKTHIYSFTDCAFGAVIKPYFSPHLKKDETLVICPINPSK